jgi:hypothetical protein
MGCGESKSASVKKTRSLDYEALDRVIILQYKHANEK